MNLDTNTNRTRTRTSPAVKKSHHPGAKESLLPNEPKDAPADPGILGAVPGAGRWFSRRAAGERPCSVVESVNISKLPEIKCQENRPAGKNAFGSIIASSDARKAAPALGTLGMSPRRLGPRFVEK